MEKEIEKVILNVTLRAVEGGKKKNYAIGTIFFPPIPSSIMKEVTTDRRTVRVVYKKVVEKPNPIADHSEEKAIEEPVVVFDKSLETKSSIVRRKKKGR